MNESLELEIRLFAAAAERAGRSVVVKATLPITIADLRTLLERQVPVLASILDMSRWAVDHHFVDGSYLLDRPREIAVIPPVSGG